MVLYVVFEGIVARTISGKDIPEGISDMSINNKFIDWLTKNQNSITDIVLLSNQTWIYSSPGIKNEEKFWAKIKYVSECLKEHLERLGNYCNIIISYSIKKPWTYGLNDNGKNLVEYAKEINQDLINKPELFMCRPIPFDLDFAKRSGFTNIKTSL